MKEGSWLVVYVDSHDDVIWVFGQQPAGCRNLGGVRRIEYVVMVPHE